VTSRLPRLLRTTGRLVMQGLAALGCSNPLYVGPVPPLQELEPEPERYHPLPNTHPDEAAWLTEAERRSWADLQSRILHDTGGSHPAGAS
jgi:hypothetical protein